MVREVAAGKRFLNLFAYTGSFSVYAAAGGAAETVTVDLSNTYLDWARRNMALNGFTGPRARIRPRRRNALSRSRAAAARRSIWPWSMPPRFPTAKPWKTTGTSSGTTPRCLSRLVELMTPGGTIFFSTNFRRFKLAEAELAGLTIREISRQTVPPDFRNRRIHRCWRAVKVAGTHPASSVQ